MTAEDKAAVKSSTGAGGAPPPLSELKRLGKYQIEKKVGAGGMGTVFLARAGELKRTVALKVLPRDKAENPILVRRFRAEAQAAAQLRHPNIVAVYDSGEADGYLYIAMEFVDGRDLFDMVSHRGVIPVRRSIDIIRQVAAALQHAYEQNIVHRDIKPSNLLIRRDGIVKLTDLGLARSVDDTLETNITRAGTTVGTVDYMAPEQARNSKLADIRSDLYSLGCTWYQMLTGVAPYPDGSVTNKLQAHAIKPIPDPRDKNPQIPEGLTAVIRRMMAKKPEDRYQTPAELIDELDHAKLTQASIAREIFSDLSDDDDDDANAYSRVAEDDEEGFSDDSYFELDERRKTQDTPEQGSSRPGNVARKRPVRPSRSEEPDEPDEADDSAPTPYKARPRPAKSERREPDSKSANSGAQSGRLRDVPQDDDEDDSDPVAPKAKSRSGKPGANDPAAKPTETKASDAKHSEQKPSDQKSPDSKLAAKPKGPVPKPMPPKREPIDDPAAGRGSLFNRDLFRYLGAISGVILVILGIGWLISSYASNVVDGTNPFGTATTEPAGPAVTPGPAAVATTKQTETPPEVATGTVAANTPTGTKPETAAAPYDVEKLPDWALREADLVGLQQLTVSTAAKSSTNFTTLEEALRAVPAGGAVIKLIGAGPFPLPLVELGQQKRIVISSGAPQERAVIHLKPGEGQTTAGIKLKDGTLDLRGLHFSLDRQAMSGPFKAIEIVDGQLLAQQCSFTASGTGADSAVALEVNSLTDSTSVPRIEPNLLLDRVFVRGDGFEGLRINRANVDAVIRESLVASGSAAAIELTGHVVPGVAEVSTNKPRRILRVVRSTLSSQSRVFDLSVDDAGKPPQTAVVLRDSICAAQGVVSNSAIAFAGRWPQVRTTSESWLTRMTWQSTNTLYLGFEQLIDLGSSFKVVDSATWQRVWNVRSDARQFQKMPFPESTVDDLAAAQPQDFDSGSLGYREVKATDGGLPGCPVARLSVPDVVSQQRAVAMTSRPSLAAILKVGGDPVQVRKVDLKKDDLGVVLNRGDWPSGTLFEATGGGLCLMTPAKVDGKSFKIVFRQTEGSVLKLQPAQPKTTEASKTGPSELIAISNGTLEMSHAVLEGHPNPKSYTPEWLIRATDATVILNGCRLMGSEADGARQSGLIWWSSEVTPKVGAAPPALVIRDCYLAGSGTAVRVNSAQGSIILRNSIVAARGDALDLRPIRVGTSLSSVLDAENLTVSATNAIIRFQAAAGADPITSPWRIFMDRCVFAPPLAFKAGESAKATVLQCVGPVIEQQQLEWWGTANGLARQIPYMIRRDGDSGAPAEDRTGHAAWRKLWGKTSSNRLLTGDKGVYLAGELPVRWKELKPASFELHKSAVATTWAEGNRPIGASIQAVEEAGVAKKTGGDTAKPTAVIPPVNANKKNVGF